MKKSTVVLGIGLLVILLGFTFTGRVQAQEQTPVVVTDDQVNQVASQLYCPVCENISLDVCPTQACEQWRSLIREKLEAGWSAEQIKEYFAAQYGDRVLPEPPKKGLNWMVYILPPAMIAGGALLLAWIILGMRARKVAPVSAEQTPQSSGEYLARVEEELLKRKGE
jgi:cytochrome c-type biogenesis protein CcmH